MGSGTSRVVIERLMTTHKAGRAAQSLCIRQYGLLVEKVDSAGAACAELCICEKMGSGDRRCGMGRVSGRAQLGLREEG